MITLLRITAGLFVLFGVVGNISGQEPDRIIMPHGLHHEAEVECATCHDGIESSTNALEVFRPDMDVCADCHDVEADDECAICHTNVDEAEALDPPRPVAELFSHSAHQVRDLDCAVCHGDPALDQPQMPAKPDCRECHETLDDYGDCRMCHGTDEQLRPMDHDLGWLNHHGLAARVDQASCSLCHTETTCQDCHSGDNVRPRSHGLNFAFEHAISARGNEMACMTCHQEPEYCAGCHIAERVLPRNHSQAGWVRMTDGGRHAVDGLFEIESCVACHSEGANAPTCAQCHGG